MRNKGLKTFKPIKTTQTSTESVYDLSNISLDEAKARLEKKYRTSSYDEIYGRQVGLVDFGNSDILSFKKMS